MKRLVTNMLRTGVTALLMVAASSQTLIAEQLDVVGNLEARGSVQVTGDGAPAPVKLTDTTYAYISGDIIKTGQGSGVLQVSGLGRIALAPATEAAVRSTDHGLAVDLNSGALAYALVTGMDVTINAAGMTITPTRSPLQTVSAGNGTDASGWIRVGADGEVEVASRDGRIEIRQAGSVQVVEAGQNSVVRLRNGKLIATQAGGSAGAGGGIGMENLIILAMAAGGAAVGLALSGSNDEPLASP